ncbi:MAG: ribonuclease H-like domain-containing protein [Acidobacteriia bacterium]|nr:ribonuclease H-like domain-containing protein [Terriglobia bacterium]
MASAARRADARCTAPPPPRAPLESCIPGGAVENAAGTHYQTGKLFEHFRRYGSLDISELAALPHDFLDGISSTGIPPASPLQWAFLDTETTGLSGGSGTCAFLIGLGKITPEGFRVRQYFMRDYGEEASALDALAADLEGVQVLVTYNGKSFDLPLLETRYRLARRQPPFTHIPHLDLLHGARRLWRLRLESCSLIHLESRILGLTREGDVAGALIPNIYFDYLRSGSAARLSPVFHHNVLDIVTLAALTAVVPAAFRETSLRGNSPQDGARPGTVAGCRLGVLNTGTALCGQATVRHPAEMVSLGRWLRSEGRLEQALEMFRRATAAVLPDDLLFRALWDAAAIEKKLGRHEAAIALYTDLAACRNPHRIAALEELAKHYEHREHNWAMALEFTQTALECESTGALKRRHARLLRRQAARG